MQEEAEAHQAYRLKHWPRLPDRFRTANVLRAPADAGAPVVHCSSVATIGLPADGAPGTEDTPLPPSQVIGAYKRSKVASERMALDAAARGQHVVVVNPTAPVEQPVVDAHLVSRVQQHRAEHGADVAGASGDQYSHCDPLCASSQASLR